MKFQDDISNMNTYIRPSRNQYVPHFFKVGGIKSDPSLSTNFKVVLAKGRYLLLGDTCKSF